METMVLASSVAGTVAGLWQLWLRRPRLQGRDARSLLRFARVCIPCPCWRVLAGPAECVPVSRLVLSFWVCI